MTDIIAEGEAFLAKLRAEFSPEVKTVENDVHAVVTDAVSYIKVNGLQDLEQIALTLVTAMVPGTSWAALLASIKAQAITDGVALLDGSEDIVASKVKADLTAIGTVPALAPAA